jgi:Lon protease-like protein
VVLIRRGQEALGPLAEPHEIGCTARIQSLEELEDGRMNLVAIGEQRFRLLSLRREKPYLVGLLDLFPLEGRDPGSLLESTRQLRPWVVRYMEILAEAGDLNLDPEQLPDDPLVLAYLAAVLIQAPLPQKQALLAAEHADDLLVAMQALYRREVALLQAIRSGEQNERPQSFGAN